MPKNKMIKTQFKTGFMKTDKSEKKPTVQKLDKKVKKIVSELNEQIETKCLFAVSEGVAVANASLYTINSMARGDTVSTRTGDYINCKTLWLRYHAYEDDQSVIFRVIVFSLKKFDNTVASFDASVLFSTTTPHSYMQYNVPSLVTTTNMDNVRVHYDQTHAVGTNVKGNDYHVYEPKSGYSIKIPLNFKTGYRFGNAGTQADISENGLYLMFITQNGITIDQFNFSTQLYFTDS